MGSIKNGAMKMEIYLDDLKEDKQEEILNGRNLDSAEEGNLDVFPLAVVRGAEKDEVEEA